MFFDNLRKLIMTFMKKQSGFGLVIPLTIIAVTAALAIGARYITKKDDSPLEEFAETALEDELETVLDLPNDSLKGKIDFTPDSKET